MDDETCSVINGINPDCYQCWGTGFRPDVLEMMHPLPELYRRAGSLSVDSSNSQLASIMHFEFDNLTSKQRNDCENFRIACDRHKCYFL